MQLIAQHILNFIAVTYTLYIGAEVLSFG